MTAPKPATPAPKPATPAPAANALDALVARRDAVARQIDATRAKLAPAEDALCNAKDDFKLGQFPEAQAAIAELQPKVSAMQAEVGALLDARDELNDQIRATEETIAREAAARAEAARPRQIAEAGRAYRAAVAAVDVHAKAFVNSIEALSQTGNALAVAAGTAEARRLFSAAAVIYRLRTGLYSIFLPRARSDGGIMTIADMFGIAAVVGRGDKNAERGFLAVNLEIADLHEVFFLTEEDARAACRRRDPTGESLFVFKRPDGLFILQAGRRRMQGAA